MQLDDTWRAFANCHGMDPAIFHPVEEDDDGVEARQVCAGCVVRIDCLEWALANRQRFGIWGGLSEHQRRRILRNRRREAGTPTLFDPVST